MKTSLNETKLIDGFIFNNNPAEDALLFDTMLIINPALTRQVVWQKKTHAIIQQYSRKHLKAEIESAHQIVFGKPKHKSFRQKIFSFFK